VSDKYFPWPILMLPLGLGFIVGMLLGTISTSSSWKASAVKTGHAQWVANERGEAEFKWKEAKP
jgi:hypothetical protein